MVPATETGPIPVPPLAPTPPTEPELPQALDHESPSGTPVVDAAHRVSTNARANLSEMGKIIGNSGKKRDSGGRDSGRREATVKGLHHAARPVSLGVLAPYLSTITNTSWLGPAVGPRLHFQDSPSHLNSPSRLPQNTSQINLQSGEETSHVGKVAQIALQQMKEQGRKPPMRQNSDRRGTDGQANQTAHSPNSKMHDVAKRRRNRPESNMSNHMRCADPSEDQCGPRRYKEDSTVSKWDWINQVKEVYPTVPDFQPSSIDFYQKPMGTISEINDPIINFLNKQEANNTDVEKINRLKKAWVEYFNKKHPHYLEDLRNRTGNQNSPSKRHVPHTSLLHQLFPPFQSGTTDLTDWKLLKSRENHDLPTRPWSA